MKKILVIQTAFIGDVVLATAVTEKLKQYFPDAQIDLLVRKGNESLLQNNLNISNTIVWNKKERKWRHLFAVLKQIKQTRYDKVINLQRFFTTGLLTVFSGAKEKIGFDKNPWSMFFSKSIKHTISSTSPYLHEVERNHQLIKDFTDDNVTKPKLYPSQKDTDAISIYATEPYITISPSSVWFTKRYPFEKWCSFINAIPLNHRIYLLGGGEDKKQCDELKAATKGNQVTVLAGTLSFLQSAALMQKAVMNYTNDSAPLHFASAVNAPVTAVFCSTVQAFGFTPLSDNSFIAEIEKPLYCRPCGLHGKKECPEKHFRCAWEIENNQLLQPFYSQLKNIK